MVILEKKRLEKERLESLEQKNQRSTIILLRNTFNEMVSQEIFLIKKYEQALIEIEKDDSIN